MPCRLEAHHVGRVGRTHFGRHSLVARHTREHDAGRLVLDGHKLPAGTPVLFRHEPSPLTPNDFGRRPRVPQFPLGQDLQLLVHVIEAHVEPMLINLLDARVDAPAHEQELALSACRRSH